MREVIQLVLIKRMSVMYFLALACFGLQYHNEVYCYKAKIRRIRVYTAFPSCKQAIQSRFRNFYNQLYKQLF